MASGTSQRYQLCRQRTTTYLCKSGIAADAVGADGLLIECHLDPEHALSNGAQSITPAVLRDLMRRMKRIAEAVDREL